MGSEDTPAESPSAFGCDSGGKRTRAQAALPAQLCLPGLVPPPPGAAAPVLF